MNKLTNKKFKEFFEKYSDFRLPDESHLRKNYLPQLYRQTITKIRDHIKDQYIYICIDETTDTLRRHIFNT